MGHGLRFFFNRIRQAIVDQDRWWFQCYLQLAVLLIKMVDTEALGELVPTISEQWIKTLLTIITGSMLMIATFAVGSMVSAYASASNNATPRSFSLIIADDGSQNALSTFIGTFIYSVVALIAMENGYYGEPRRFALFVLTSLALTIVIVTFVRWVDRISSAGASERNHREG